MLQNYDFSRYCFLGIFFHVPIIDNYMLHTAPTTTMVLLAGDLTELSKGHGHH
jgi:hypothetical protein